MFASPLDDDARGPGATWSRVPSFRSEATESVAPWWSLHSGTAAHLDEHPAPPAALSTSLQPGGRWAVDAAPPPWFKAAFHMQQNRTLEAEEAFAITELMAGGDAEDLEELLKIEVRPDPAGGQSTASFAVEADPLADLARVEPGARVYWSPAHDNLRGVASHHVDGDQGANEWYRLVARPYVDADAHYVANAVSLCQRNDDLPAARRRKRGRDESARDRKRPRTLSASLADVDGVHLLVDEVDAAHAIMELLSA